MSQSANHQVLATAAEIDRYLEDERLFRPSLVRAPPRLRDGDGDTDPDASPVTPVAPDDAPFSAADYVQIACLGHHSVIINVETDGVHSGEILIHGGEVWSARDGAGCGNDAFARLTTRNGVHTTCHALQTVPGPRRIEGDWQALLLEAAQALDEGRLPDGDEDAARLSPADFAARFDAGVDAILRKDFAAAYAAFVAAEQAHPGDARVAANLKRLTEMGYGEAS